jgi:2'-hydroxyisoflavone reductase
MPTSRRSFLKLAAATGGAIGLGVAPNALSAATTGPLGAPLIHPPNRRAKLRILILGGTGFIGPYQVQYALDRGHSVTLFNRGQTNPQLFPNVEKLVGDRANNLDSLKGKTWDVVLDNSATNPEWVERSAQLLATSVKHYYFVSTRSVYADTSHVPLTIDAPVFNRQNSKVEAGKPLPYGLAKAESEAAARKHFGARTLVVRPGLIIGPGDLTDRFTYWPVRIERGGEVLAPGDGTDPVQVIDARDLSEWMIRLAEQGATGTYNVVGPKNPRSFAELLHGIKASMVSEATFTWVDTDFLASQKVRPYAEMPVWMPAKGGHEGFARVDLTREVALGLTFRPLTVTARDTLDYYHAQSPERQATLKAGLTPERELQVLEAWRSRKG